MKNTKIVIGIGLSISLVITWIVASWFLNQRNASSTDTLVVGMMSGWPPYMSIDSQGQYVGFDVDVAKAIGKKLGKTIELKDMGSLATLFLALQQGKIDMILSGLDITQERQERMKLIPYTGQGITSLYIMFYQQIPGNVTSLDAIASIANAVVCVEPNSTSDKLIDLYPAITKKQLKSMADMVLDIRSGKSMAFLAEPAVARRLMKKDQELVSLEVPLPSSLQIYGMGIAIKKENSTLTAEIASAVKELRRTGQLDELEKQWNLKGE